MTLLDLIAKLASGGLETPEHNELGQLVGYKYPNAFKGYHAVIGLTDTTILLVTRLADGHEGARYWGVIRPLTRLEAEVT